MRCPDCGATTRVVNTRPQPGGVRRQHRCPNCNFGGYTGEAWLHIVYSPENVAAAKQKMVDTRRANEDRRLEDAS